MRYEAVLFDLDGTLIDSEPLLRRVAQGTAREFDRDFSDELYLSLVGLPAKELEQGILAAFGDDFPLAEFRERFAVRWAKDIVTYGIAIKPGVEALLDTLDAQKIPYAIATSTPHERARECLRFAQLHERFEHLIGGDEIERGKPAPDIYLKAATRLGIAPERCIAIEDSKIGVMSAATANMYTIVVPDIKLPDAETKTLAAEVLPSMSVVKTRIHELMNFPITT